MPSKSSRRRRVNGRDRQEAQRAKQLASWEQMKAAVAAKYETGEVQ